MCERKRMTDQKKKDEKSTEERTQLKECTSVQGCVRQV